MDHIIGILNAKNLLARLAGGGSFDIVASMSKPQFVPDSMPPAKVLDMFRASGQHIAIVLDEYGGMEGLVTIQDILEEIIGDVEDTAPQATRRDDGSWLIDGLMEVDDFKELFMIDELPGEHDSYVTVGGFVMSQLGHIPSPGATFDWTKLHVEVLDMDGNRVDKVMVIEQEPETPDEEAGNEPDAQKPETKDHGDA
jgi:putative hemolysin